MIDTIRSEYALSTAESQVSRLKTELKRLNEPKALSREKREALWKELKMTKAETNALKKRSMANLRAQGTNMRAINADQLILDARNILEERESRPPSHILVALAAVTGRRTSELIITGSFDPPVNRDSKWWASFRGQAKTRGDFRVYDIPLFATRDLVVKSVRELRKHWGRVQGITTAERANSYAGDISAAMAELAPEIGTVHKFRRFYVLVCQVYFNEDNKSLPVLASEYLGHKEVSSAVLPYLNMLLARDLGTLDFS
jgi:hypothetical protein